MEILEFHPPLWQEGYEPDWRGQNRINEAWIEAIPSKECPEFIERLWIEANEDFGSVEEFRSFYDNDGVETDAIEEAIAYYSTFRSINKGLLIQDWGIHFNIGGFFAFVRRIASSAGKPGLEVLDACYHFVLQHEINHYEVDLGIFFLEVHSGQRNYFLRPTPNLLEEALGNGRGASNPKVKKIKKIVVDRYANSSLAGYNELEKYLTPKRQAEAFNEILFESVKPAHPKGFPLAHEFMKPGKPFSSNKVPIYFHISSGGIVAKAASTQNFNYVVNKITYSESGRRDIEKLVKKNSQIQTRIEKAERKIIENPNAHGNRLRKFQGSKGMIEARIDQGFRMLLQDRGQGTYEVIHVGNDLYEH
jgi:hypothetical protein